MGRIPLTPADVIGFFQVFFANLMRDYPDCAPSPGGLVAQEGEYKIAN